MCHCCGFFGSVWLCRGNHRIDFSFMSPFQYIRLLWNVFFECDLFLWEKIFPSTHLGHNHKTINDSLKNLWYHPLSQHGEVRIHPESCTQERFWMRLADTKERGIIVPLQEYSAQTIAHLPLADGAHTKIKRMAMVRFVPFTQLRSKKFFH